jgi:hypothetical protein
LLLAFGCQATPSSATRSALATAAETERTRCGAGVDEAAVVSLLDQHLIESAEPIYANLGVSRQGPEKRLTGALIRIRPTQGMTAQWLDRALECHSARRTLGQSTETLIANDPFWLPDSTVDIDVEEHGDSLWASVRADTPAKAQAILDRANSFIAANAVH